MLRRIRVVRWRSGVVSPVAVTAARSVYAGSWPMCPPLAHMLRTSLLDLRLTELCQPAGLCCILCIATASLLSRKYDAALQRKKKK